MSAEEAARGAESRGPVVVIGLDMGDGALIRAWSREGLLPNLAALIEAGTWFDLRSPAAALHTSTWPTFATGDLPGRHGVYYPYQAKPGFQEAQLISPTQYAVPTLWQRADAQGKRCLIYDVPETFPADGFSGTAIFEWGTWAWYGQRCSQPESVLNEIKHRFGAYPLRMEAKKLGARFPDPVMLERRLLASIEHKRDSFEWLMRQSSWDLAIMVFGETHPAGHYLWPAGALVRDETNDSRFASMLRVYQAIDAAVGSIRASLEPDSAFMLVSGDGVTVNNVAWHLMAPVLERLGYLVPPTPPDGGETPRRRFSVGGIKDMVPKGARRWIADRLPWWLRDRIGARIRAAAIDWSRTRAFTLPTDLEGCIRVNLKGREPEGIVLPEEYDALCREIADQFAQLVNPATGRPAVRKVWIRNEIFPGPAQEHLPDIMVSWDGSSTIEALYSDATGTLELVLPDPRTGTHSSSGFCVAAGAGFGRGVSAGGRLEDVAPTVLSLLCAEEAGMDGRSLTIPS